MSRILDNVGLFLWYPKSLPKRLNYALVLIVGVTAATVILDGLALALIVPFVDILIGTEDETSSVSLIRWTSDFLEWMGLETTTGWLIAFIVVFQLVRAAGMAMQVWLTAHFRAEFEELLKRGTFTVLMRSSWSYLTTLRSGSMTNAIVSQATRGGRTYDSFAITLSALITSITYFAGSLIISWELSLLAAGYALLLMISLSYFFAMGKRLGARLATNGEDVLNEISESVGGLKIVKSSALETSVIGRFSHAARRYARTDSLIGLQQGAMQSLFELLFMVALVAGLFFASRTLDLTNSAILLFTLLFFRIFQRARGIQTGLQSFYQLIPSLEVIRRFQQQASSNSERTTGGDFQKLERKVEFSNVQYEYLAGHPVLNDISMEIEAKKSVAIVGPSGVGKTTVVDMVVGLIDPTSGSVSIDDRPLTEISLEAWRGRIAYVTQGSILFRDTVARNIALGVDNVTHEDIEEAATLAGANDFISRLPQGYETLVGERGITLSGGQRQRIALARALIRKPDLLILDEATSELDVASEQRFQATLAGLQGHTAMLIVAHRLSTVMGVDRVYVLDDGRVSESGSPRELIDQKGRFYSMLQQAGQVN